jgi:hypothetical protein
MHWSSLNANALMPWCPASAWQAACNMVGALSCIKHCGMPFPVRWISGIYLSSEMFCLHSLISGGMRKCVPDDIHHHHFLCIIFLLWWVAVPIILRPVLRILLIYLRIYVKIGLTWKEHSTQEVLIIYNVVKEPSNVHPNCLLIGDSGISVCMNETRGVLPKS